MPKASTMMMLAISILMTVLPVGPAFAAHDQDLFELEGNALNDPNVLGDDWKLIYCDHIDLTRSGICTGVPASNAFVSTFVTDPVESPSDDIFAGAKDTLDIAFGKWSWKVGEPNDKNDIEHGYASLYQKGSDFWLYFGMDKLSNNGDAAIGFWFLQNEVTQVGNIGGNPALDFSPNNAHKPGDVLIQADITSGGDVPRFDVYTWGQNGLLNEAVAPAQGLLTRAIHGSECGGTADDDTCAIMNKGNETAPWPYKFKFSGGVADSSVFPVATFFEAGLNLSKIFPNGIPCISTFLAETRQSQSETAELEDKMIGRFDLCSINVIKTAKELSKAGDTFNYTITITNDGALPLEKVSIIDDKLGDLTNYAGSTCGATLAPQASCSITVPKTVTAGDPTALTNKVTATYQRSAGTVSDPVTAFDDHTLTLIVPTISFDKKANSSDGPLSILQGDTVSYSLYLENTTSTTNAPNLECIITDNLLTIDPNNTDGDNNTGTIKVTLANGQDTTVNASKPFPDAGSFTNTANVSCTPIGFSNKVPAEDSVTVTVLPSNQALTVVKTGDGFSKTGDAVDYTITITNIITIPLKLDAIVDNVLGDLTDSTNTFVTSNTCGATLAGGASCTIKATRTTLDTDDDPLNNTVDVDFSSGTGSDSVSDNHSVDLVHPKFTLSKTCTPETFPAGSSVSFTINIVNTGDVNLETKVTDALLGIDTTQTLNQRDGKDCAAADFASPNAGPEDGCWEITQSIIANDDITNTVDVLAILPSSYGLPNELSDSKTSTCTAEQGGATRTQGFWKTHGGDNDVQYNGYTCHVFQDHLGGTVNLGWTVLSNCEDVFGVYWSNPAKQSTGAKRPALCKTELLASHQLLAALFNDGLTNGAPVPQEGGVDVTTLLINAMSACHDSNSATACSEKEIKRLASILGGYNESGDDVSIVDADGAVIPPADPNGMRSTADYSAADCNTTTP